MATYGPPGWNEAMQEPILPQAFVEISHLAVDDEVQDSAVATSEDVAYANLDNVNNTAYNRAKYATNELNMWSLDASCRILPDEAPYDGVGYTSGTFCDEAEPVLTVTLPAVQTTPIAGISVVWDRLMEEFATEFTVAVYVGNTAVASKTVTGNKSSVSAVEMDIAEYERVVITVHKWCLPTRRARIETVVIGAYILLTGDDLISYTHEQSACLVSGELPKNSIRFSIDNSSGRWNPFNPYGWVKYLAERQRLVVRYGLDINGRTAWISGGVFYLSEWTTPSNGLEATFVARDVLEYMMHVPYTGPRTGTLDEIVNAAVAEADLPRGAKVRLWETNLDAITVDFSGDEAEYTLSDVLQMAANAANCVMYQDRDGVLCITHLPVEAMGDYVITPDISYSHPEIEYSKPLKAVSVTYSGGTYVETFASTGETQTVSNPLIPTESVAQDVAVHVAEILSRRTSLSGEFRADPRLDVLDRIAVESKYGEQNEVYITNIRLSYSGAFRGTYEGRVAQ